MKIKIGIVGCGWITDKAHIPALKKIKEVEIVAVFDIDKEKADKLCEKYDIQKCYDDIDAFLKCGINTAIVATPNDTHTYYSLKLLENDINVLCEKPLAFNENDITQVVECSKKRGLVFFPGMVNCYREDINYFFEKLRTNRIGKVVHIEAGWIRRNGVPRPGTWFTNKMTAGGGVLTDLGSHIIDICLKFVEGSKQKDYKLVATMCHRDKNSCAEWFQRTDEELYLINVEDNAKVSINFDDNITIDINLSWQASVKGDFTYFVVTGENGSLVLKTLFGFSDQRMWDKDTLIEDVDGNQIKIEFECNNAAINAFQKMHEDFVKQILNKNVCKDCVPIDVVVATQNLYKNCIIENRTEFEFEISNLLNIEHL